MGKCKNHPNSFSSGRCLRCHVPLCSECKVAVAEGVFCSDECIEQFRSFQTHLDSSGKRGRGFWPWRVVKRFAGYIITIAVVYGGLFLWLGTADPVAQFYKLKDVILGLF